MEQRELRQLLRPKFPRERTYLLPALHFVQEQLGHLPDWALQAVSWHLRIPASEAYGAATSYSDLHIESPGPGHIHGTVLISSATCRKPASRSSTERDPV